MKNSNKILKGISDKKGQKIKDIEKNVTERFTDGYRSITIVLHRNCKERTIPEDLGLHV